MNDIAIPPAMQPQSSVGSGLSADALSSSLPANFSADRRLTAADCIDGAEHVCSNDPMVGNGRILAVDYGKKNIGLAYCDELGITIQPLQSLPNRGMKDLIANLRSTIQAMEIRELVLGIPLNMDGSRGDAVLQMEQLMDTLKLKLGLPLHGVDERLSSVEAEEFWKDMNRKQQKKYRTADSLAAALILERYLKEI